MGLYGVMNYLCNVCKVAKTVYFCRGKNIVGDEGIGTLKVGSPKINSAYCKIRKFADLNVLLDLQPFPKYVTLRIRDLLTQSFFVICRFVICVFASCGPKIFCELKIFARAQNISILLTNYSIKCCK